MIVCGNQQGDADAPDMNHKTVMWNSEPVMLSVAFHYICKPLISPNGYLTIDLGPVNRRISEWMSSDPEISLETEYKSDHFQAKLKEWVGMGLTHTHTDLLM